MSETDDGTIRTDEINALLAPVDHSLKSNKKYRAFEQYISDIGHIDPRSVYTAYISKAGNASVRFDQSSRSRNAHLLIALVDPPESEPASRTYEALQRYCGDHRPDAEFLVFTRMQGLWGPSVAIYSQENEEPQVQAFVALWPGLRVRRPAPSLAQLVPRTDTHTHEPNVRYTSTPSLSFLVLEKGRKESNISYPCAVLHRDQWDDYSIRSLFHLVLHLNPDLKIEFGGVKILHEGQETGPTPMPSGEFRRLGKDYYSLGQAFSYYENLRELPSRIRQQFIRGLGDVVGDPRIRVAFEDEPAFKTSLLRTGAAVRALEDATALFIDSSNTASSGLRFTFSTHVGGDPFDVSFSFDDSEHLPDRINTVIGYNGTGKTQLLAHLALVATGDLHQRQEFSEYGRIVNSEAVRFSSVIAVSYSAFDTFILPDAIWSSGEETRLAKERLDDTGEVFGYTYCGLRRRTKRQRQTTTAPKALKAIEEVTEEFAQARSLARAQDRKPIWLQATSIIGSEPSFGRIGTGLYSALDNAEWKVYFDSLSTGHKIVLNILVQIIGHCERRSLILVDEPESHLHPSLLAAFIRSLNLILDRFDSYAIIATHSPVVLQEVPRQYVRIVQRFGQKTSVVDPLIETFGENVGYLTTNIFHLDSEKTDYHAVLKDLAASMSLDEIEALFGDEMSMQARAYVAALQRQGRN